MASPILRYFRDVNPGVPEEFLIDVVPTKQGRQLRLTKTDNPEVVEWPTVEEFKNYGGEVYQGDSPGYPTNLYFDKVLSRQFELPTNIPDEPGFDFAASKLGRAGGKLNKLTNFAVDHPLVAAGGAYGIYQGASLVGGGVDRFAQQQNFQHQLGQQKAAMEVAQDFKQDDVRLAQKHELALAEKQLMAAKLGAMLQGFSQRQALVNQTAGNLLQGLR